jgi:hypothetical protein
MSRATDLLLQTAGLLLVSVFLVWVLVNWLMGCGESFPTANGTYIAGECVGLLDLFTINR